MVGIKENAPDCVPMPPDMLAQYLATTTTTTTTATLGDSNNNTTTGSCPFNSSSSSCAAAAAGDNLVGDGEDRGQINVTVDSSGNSNTTSSSSSSADANTSTTTGSSDDAVVNGTALVDGEDEVAEDDPLAGDLHTTQPLHNLP